MSLQDTMLKTAFIPIKKAIDFKIKQQIPDYSVILWDLILNTQSVESIDGSIVTGTIDKEGLSRLAELKGLLSMDEITSIKFDRQKNMRIDGTENGINKHFEI